MVVRVAWRAAWVPLQVQTQPAAMVVQAAMAVWATAARLGPVKTAVLVAMVVRAAQRDKVPAPRLMALKVTAAMVVPADRAAAV